MSKASLGFKKGQNVMDAYNLKLFFEDAIKKEGANITGSGTGFGQSDFDFTLNGQSYNVSIKPIFMED